MKRLGLLVLVLAASAFYACSPSRQPGNLVGAWELVSSELDMDFLQVGELVYLAFEDDPPRVGIYGRNGAIGLNGCRQAYYLTQSGLVSIWIPLVRCGSLDLGYTFAYTVEGDRLILEYANGRKAEFRRVDAVPEAAQCRYAQLGEPVSVQLPADRASPSNLVSDGAQLWVAAEDGNVYPVDPATGAVGAGQPLSGSYNHIQSWQGAAYWATCWCGNIRDIRLVKVGGTVLDSIDTDADLGHPLSIRSANYDGTRLWLAGFNRADDIYEILKVNSNAEPDVLEGVYAFDQSLSALTQHEGKLWGLTYFAGAQVVEIDPAAGRVTRAYVLPDLDEGEYYGGLASFDGALYVLAQDRGTEGTFEIYRVSP